MKLHLTLSRSELESLIQIAGWFTSLQTDNDFCNYSYVTALEVFALQHGSKFVTGVVKKKNRITLNEMQTLAFYDLLTTFSDNFKSYEYALSRKLIDAVEIQHMQEESYRQGIRNAKKEYLYGN